MYEFVSIELEKDFLRHILKDKSTVITLLKENLKQEIISSYVLRKLFVMIIDYFNDNNAVISKKELLYLCKDKFEEKEVENVELLVKALYSQEPESEFSFILEQLKEKYRVRTLTETLSESGKLLKEGNLARAESLIDSYNIEKTSIISKIEDEYSIYEKVDDVIKEIEEGKAETITGVPIGIYKVDEFIGGHLPGEFNCLVAKTYGCKTTGLCNFAINAILSSYNAAFFTIESPGSFILKKIYSNMCSIEFDRIENRELKRNEMDDMRNFFNNLKAKGGGELIVVDAMEGLTPNSLRAKIREIRNKIGKLDAVFVDYLQIMELENVKDIEIYDWKTMSTISRLMKKVARAEQVVIWTAAQALDVQKDKKSAGVDSTGDAKFAKAIKHNVDVMLELTQNKEEELLNEIKVHFTKVRRKKKHDPILIKPRLSMGILSSEDHDG